MQDAGRRREKTRAEQVQGSDESRAGSWGGRDAREMMCSVQSDGAWKGGPEEKGAQIKDCDRECPDG